MNSNKVSGSGFWLKYVKSKNTLQIQQIRFDGMRFYVQLALHLGNESSSSIYIYYIIYMGSAALPVDSATAYIKYPNASPCLEDKGAAAPSSSNVVLHLRL